MTANHLFLLLASTSGLGLSLFFSALLSRLERRPPYANQILALLLLCLSLRIGKSVYYNFVELPLSIRNLGLAFNLAVGPLLYLYGHSLRDANFRLHPSHLLHFIPTAFYIFFCNVIPNATDNLLWTVSYTLIMAQSFIYVGLSLFLFWRFENRTEARTTWYGYLILGLTSMWLVYLLIFIDLIPYYLAGASSFTLLIALLGFLAFKNKDAFINLFTEKYISSNLDEVRGAQLMEDITELLKVNQVYLNSELSVAEVAKEMGTNTKVISQVVNQHTGNNFAYLINSYRVKYAQMLLRSEEKKGEKIFAIALASGFNSLSTFNAVFKRHTGMTPGQYRRHNVLGKPSD